MTCPTIPFDEDGRLICQGIAAVERGAYDSRDGISMAARNRKVARKATAEAEAANAYQDQAEFDATMAQLDLSVPDRPPAPFPAPAKVVGARFGAPLRELSAKRSPVTSEENKRRRLWEEKRESPTPSCAARWAKEGREGVAPPPRRLKAGNARTTHGDHNGRPSATCQSCRESAAPARSPAHRRPAAFCDPSPK